MLCGRAALPARPATICGRPLSSSFPASCPSRCRRTQRGSRGRTPSQASGARVRRDLTLMVLAIRTSLRLSELTGLRRAVVRLDVGAPDSVLGKGHKKCLPALVWARSNESPKSSLKPIGHAGSCRSGSVLRPRADVRMRGSIETGHRGKLPSGGIRQWVAGRLVTMSFELQRRGPVGAASCRRTRFQSPTGAGMSTQGQET